MPLRSFFVLTFLVVSYLLNLTGCQPYTSEAYTSKTTTPEKLQPQIKQKEVQEKPQPSEFAEETSVAQKKPGASGATSEMQKTPEKGEPLGSIPPAAEEETKDFLEEVTSQIVSKLEEGAPKTKEKDFNVLVEPFLTLDGKQTMLSNLLVEELFTQLSNSRWVGSSLRICCNPAGGGATFTRLDARISGSLVKIGSEIKINARLVSADTHIILSAISTKIPASDTTIRLFEAEIPFPKPIEGEDLNTRLDSLAWQVEQILHEFQGDKKGEQRIYILGFSTLNNKKTLLESFLTQEFTLRLAKNKSWKLVPATRVKELLGKEISTLSDLSTTELKETLSGELSIDAIIDGMVTDLGNSIKVNVRVSETTEGLTQGTASIELPRDKRIEHLLSKEVGQALAVYSHAGGKEAEVTPEGILKSKEEKVDTASKPGDEFFLREDFSGPDVVYRLSEWGKDLIITTEGEKRFLASQEQGFVKIARKIDFPENFSLEFEVTGSSKYWNTLKFDDLAGNEFGLDFQLNEGNCFVVLPGPKSVRVKADISLPNKFKLVRKDGFYEVYVNDNLALAGPYSKYSLFKSLIITARLDQVRFTGFVGKAIKG